MKPILLVAKVPESQINFKAGHHKISVCASAFDWLHLISISDEFTKLKWLYGLLPPEVWKRYELHGFEDMPEQLLLNAAGKKLLKLWRTGRPRVFGKNKVEDEVLVTIPDMDVCRP